MTDFNAIEDLIHDFIVLATGLDGGTVRPFYQNSPANSTQDREALVFFNIINSTPIGIDSNKYKDETTGTDLDETIYGDRNITASIQAWTNPQSTEDARDIMELVSLWVKSSTAKQYFNENGLGYLRKGQVLDISSLQNGSYESRRQLDVEFHIVTDNTATVNAIESAEIGLNYYGSDTITETIEVIP